MQDKFRRMQDDVSQSTINVFIWNGIKKGKPNVTNLNFEKEDQKENKQEHSFNSYNPAVFRNTHEKTR